MKRIIAIVSLVLAVSSIVAAQNEKKDSNWKEKMEAEKIAFLTAEMDLTTEEAQAFWPVYNKVKAVRDEVNKAMWDSFKALKEAMNSDASDQEISRLLNEYLSASQMASSINAQYLQDYEKVLPAKKVAKYYLVEEKFRKFQFNKLQGGAPGQRSGGQSDQQGRQGGQNYRQGGQNFHQGGGRFNDRDGFNPDRFPGVSHGSGNNDMDM